MASVQEALDKIVAGVKDAAEIEVLTFTGDVRAVLTTDKKSVDWEGMFQKATADGATGTVAFVAGTWVSADGDRKEFRSSSASSELLAVHAEAVRSTVEARQAIAKTVLEIFKPLK